MLSDRPPAECGTCRYKDSIGATSVRLIASDLAAQLGIDWRDGPRLVSHDINLSNLCNIRCTTCDSSNSTRWISDEMRLGWAPRGGGCHRDSGWELSERQAATARRLEFCGGEPMLHQDRIIRAIGAVARHGNLDGLTVDITTNCMVRPSDELLDLMASAGRVHINLSVDGYGDLNDYIRFGSSWPKVASTVDLLDGRLGRRPEVYMAVNTVYSVFNANAMAPIWDWLRGYAWQGNTHNIIICLGPEWADARMLPWEHRAALAEMYRDLVDSYPERRGVIGEIVNHLSDGTEVGPLDEHLRTIAAVDAVRRSSLAASNPIIAGMLGMTP
jgi:MoaA/NifB/PqqE/SkfB family radical SAM enzyme